MRLIPTTWRLNPRARVRALTGSFPFVAPRSSTVHRGKPLFPTFIGRGPHENMKSLCFCGDETRQPSKGLSLLSVRILLSIPEMLFVMISCADDMSWMSWLITTRVFSQRKQNRCANPIRTLGHKYHPQRTPSIVFARRRTSCLFISGLQRLQIPL